MFSSIVSTQIPIQCSHFIFDCGVKRLELDAIHSRPPGFKVRNKQLCITPLSLMPSCLVSGQFVLPVPTNLVGWEVRSMVGRTWLLSISRDMIYLSTEIRFTPGGSSTVHVYTQTIHRRTQITTNFEEWRPCPVFASFTLAFALQLRKKHGKTSVRVVEEC